MGPETKTTLARARGVIVQKDTKKEKVKPEEVQYQIQLTSEEMMAFGSSVKFTLRSRPEQKQILKRLLQKMIVAKPVNVKAVEPPKEKSSLILLNQEL